MIDTTAVRDSARGGFSRSREEAVAERVRGGADFRGTLRNALETVEHREGAIDQRQRLMNTCIEMESLFVSKMLSEMRKTINKGDWLHGGFAEEVFTDMLYDEYALQISRNSNLGLARQLYDEMSRNL